MTRYFCFEVNNFFNGCKPGIQIDFFSGYHKQSFESRDLMIACGCEAKMCVNAGLSWEARYIVRSSHAA